MDIVFLGTGPSKNVRRENEIRTNSSIFINGILIDVTPNFLEQVKKQNISDIKLVFLTHAHKDAIGGLFDLDNWITHQLNIYAPSKVLNNKRLKKEFKNLILKPILPNKKYKFDKKEITAFRVIHYEYHPTLGKNFPAYGYRINNLIYAEDMERIPKNSESYFENAEIIIADGAMYFNKQIRGHLSVDQTLELAKKYKPKKLIIIQAGHTYPPQKEAEKEINKYWDEIKEKIDTKILLAYDGLKISNKELYFDFFSEDEEFELQLQIFGSPGGKTRISEKLVSLIPKHKTFIEPFVGGGAVYFKKEPSEVEVINDKDSEIAFAYNFIKNITDEQVNKLKSYNWNPGKELFFKLRDSDIPKDDIQRFYRFYYVLIYSYGLSSKTYGYFIKNKFHIEKRLDKLKERLKNTKIYNKDYLEVLKEYNSPDTFTYLDPPYPKEWAGKEGIKWFSMDDVRKLHDFLKNDFKGKFILSINTKEWIRKMFSNFKIFKIKVPRTFHHGDEAKYELIISNYNLKELSETGSGDVGGGEITGGGLHPIWIWGKDKKKKKKLELIEDIKEYDPKDIPNNILADDWRIVLAWYSTYKKTDGKGIKFSLETIVNLAKLIYDEIERRVKEGKMKHEFNPEKMEESSKEIYSIVSENKIFKMSEITEDINNLKPVINQFKPAIIIKDFISLVGSSVKRDEEHKPNDYDIHVRMEKDKIAEYLERTIKVRLSKMVGEKLSNKLHIFCGDASGSHDTYVPIYDLVLIPSEHKVVEMSKEKINIFKPFLPMKPAGSAYYDLKKFIEALK